MLHLDRGTVAIDESRPDRSITPSERSTSSRLASRSRPRIDVGCQPALGLGELLLEQLLPLVQPGVADLDVGTARRQRSGPAIEFGPQFATGTGRIDLRLLVGFETRQQGGQLVGAALLALHRASTFDQRGVESLALGDELSQLALCPGQPLGRGAELRVVGIECLHEIGLAALRGGQRSLRLGQRARRDVERVAAAAADAAIASSSAAAVAPELPAPMRHPLSPNRSPFRVTTTASGWSRATSTAVVMSLDADGHTEQAVEQFGHARPRRPHVRAGRPRRAPGSPATNGRAPSAMTAPLVAESRSASSARRPAVGSSTTTAVSDSPNAASTAGPHPSSISTRSSSVPSTPSTPTSRSAPARARAASSASCRASTRAAARAAASASSARSDRRASVRAAAASRADSAASTSTTSDSSTLPAPSHSPRNRSAASCSARDPLGRASSIALRGGVPRRAPDRGPC